MPQGFVTGVGPNQITFPLRVDTENLFEIASMAIDNGTAAALTISDLAAAPFYNVPPYQSRSIVCQNIQGFIVTNPNGTAINPTDTLNIQYYDKVLLPSFSSYGPAAWGAGMSPASLTFVIPGNPFLNSQINQIISYLTNQNNVAGNMTVNGKIGSLGTSAGFNFRDRDGIGSDSFEWYANAGFARLFSSFSSGDVLTIDESGNIAMLASANLTGAQTLHATFIDADTFIENNGVHFYAGSGAPGALLGVNGDFYCNAAGGAGTTIYQKRAGNWVGIV